MELNTILSNNFRVFWSIFREIKNFLSVLILCNFLALYDFQIKQDKSIPFAMCFYVVVSGHRKFNVEYKFFITRV